MSPEQAFRTAALRVEVLRLILARLDQIAVDAARLAESIAAVRRGN